MSRTPFAPLFDRLVDDAAVFPPGLAPLDVAVHEHLDRRDGRYSGYIGPLLVPASSAVELAGLAASDARTAERPFEVALVVRPGTPSPTVSDPLVSAVDLLRDDPRVVVMAAEVGWFAEWRALLDLDLPLVVEVGIGTQQESALDDIATAVDDQHDVVAKFRTGQTPTWPWPDETMLAGFIDAAVLRGLPFKLTGGLHHVARGQYTGERMHGVLNVLLATHEALDGAEAPHLAATLARSDTEVLASAVSGFDADHSARVRRTLTAFGCCGVMDPIGELEALGLLG